VLVSADDGEQNLARRPTRAQWATRMNVPENSYRLVHTAETFEYAG
jgi:hypothetical protein